MNQDVYEKIRRKDVVELIKGIKPVLINTEKDFFVFELKEGRTTVTKNHKGWICDNIHIHPKTGRKFICTQNKYKENPCKHIQASIKYLEILGIIEKEFFK